MRRPQLASAWRSSRRRSCWSARLLLPVVFNIYLSFTKWQKFTGLDQFAGSANYQRLFADPYFAEAALNTADLGGRLADRSRGARPRARAAAAQHPVRERLQEPHLPAARPGADRGRRDLVLRLRAARRAQLRCPLSPANPFDFGWLYPDNTITPSIIVTFVWQTVGITMVLLLLGLAAIPRDPIEAARMDGATPWQIFRHIDPAAAAADAAGGDHLSMSLAGFTTFDLLWVMGASFPGKRTLSLAVYMYYEAFPNGAWAYGSARSPWCSARMVHRGHRAPGGAPGSRRTTSGSRPMAVDSPTSNSTSDAIERTRAQPQRRAAGLCSSSPSLVSLIWLMPFYYLIVSVFKSSEEYAAKRAAAAASRLAPDRRQRDPGLDRRQARPGSDELRDLWR